MENLKIKVNNEAESKEAQELLTSAGLSKIMWSNKKLPILILTSKTTFSDFDGDANLVYDDYNEITISQLHDMVVLKRNDVGDANVIDPTRKEDILYLHSDNNMSIYNVRRNKWIELGFILNDDIVARLKPISKEDFSEPEELPFIDDEPKRENNHYFIDVSDVDEIDFYEIANRYNVTDPCIQHILKKCLAVGNRGHKDFNEDIKDIYKTAERAMSIHKVI